MRCLSSLGVLRGAGVVLHWALRLALRRPYMNSPLFMDSVLPSAMREFGVMHEISFP